MTCSFRNSSWQNAPVVTRMQPNAGLPPSRTCQNWRFPAKLPKSFSFGNLYKAPYTNRQHSFRDDDIMQTLEQQITQQTRGLPESAQREVLHYIEFIRSRYPVAKPATKTAGKRKTSWSDTPLYGLWQDRAEMADPAAYVRHLRRSRF